MIDVVERLKVIFEDCAPVYGAEAVMDDLKAVARIVADQEMRLRLLERHFNAHDRREPAEAAAEIVAVRGKQVVYKDGGRGLSEEGRRYMEAP